MSATATAIVAMYNQREYAAEAVLGLAGQVREVIVVDDASTDGTSETLRELGIPNLVVLTNPSRAGVSISFNRAAAAASSDVLLIQGGDDRSLPGRADRQVAALEDATVSMVYSLPIVIDSGGQRLPADLAGEFLAGASDPSPLEHLFLRSNYLCAPSVAVRTADYLRLGGFRAGLDLLQDYDLWLALAAEGDFVRLDPPVVEYRKHASNLSREYTALDSPKRRRLAAERGEIRNRFLDHASDAVLDRIARACSLDLERLHGLDRADRLTALRLSHPDKLVVRRGLDALFAVVADADAPRRLAAMGLDSTDLARFATIADVDDLADVALAFGAVHVGVTDQE